MAQWNMIGHRLFASELIGNPFYLHAITFEISKKYFVIKPPVCWGVDILIEIYSCFLQEEQISKSSERGHPQDVYGTQLRDVMGTKWWDILGASVRRWSHVFFKFNSQTLNLLWEVSQDFLVNGSSEKFGEEYSS